jgi:hypothetical protein
MKHPADPRHLGSFPDAPVPELRVILVWDHPESAKNAAAGSAKFQHSKHGPTEQPS